MPAMQPSIPAQVQPASLDLRLGPVAYRIRASFLPGKGSTVESKLLAMQSHVIDLTKGAVLETECVYLVPLMERLDLRSTLSATANPKSSTGRLDVFTRLIADGTNSFDYVPPGYSGPLYIEISPRSFSILVRQGSRLNQLRVLRRTTRQARDKRFLSDAELRALHKRSPLVELRAGPARRPEPARRPDAANGPAADRLQGQALRRRGRRRPDRRLRRCASSGIISMTTTTDA